MTIFLTVPNGSGGNLTKAVIPDLGGYFAFDSIPIGNHDLTITYQPSSDTIQRFVSVLPNSKPYLEFRLPGNVWFDSTGSVGIEHMAGSDSLYADCHGFYFWIENNSGGDITATSVTLTWPPPVSYYRYVMWDGVIVFDEVNAKVGSGEDAVFTSPQTIADGHQLRIDIDFFKSIPTGGADVDMNDLTFTINFSDGSSFNVSTGACP